MPVLKLFGVLPAIKSASSACPLTTARKIAKLYRADPQVWIAKVLGRIAADKVTMVDDLLILKAP